MKTALSLPLGYCDLGLLLQTSVYICFSFMWRILIPNSSFTDLSLPSYAGKEKAATAKGGINDLKCRAGLQPTTEPSLPNTFPPFWPTPPCRATTPTRSCTGLGHVGGSIGLCVWVLLSSGWPLNKTLLVVSGEEMQGRLRAQIIRAMQRPWASGKSLPCLPLHK